MEFNFKEAFTFFKNQFKDGFFWTKIINTKDLTDPVVKAIQNSQIDNKRNLNQLTEEVRKSAEKPEEDNSREVTIKGVSVVAIKGDPGEKPTKKELLDLINPLIPTPKDGKTPVKYKDYFTKKEIAEIVKTVQSSIRVPMDGVSPELPLAGVDYPSHDQIKSFVESAIRNIPDPKDGFTPKHEWEDGKLRFENPDGTWGEWQELVQKTTQQGSMMYSNTFVKLRDVPRSYTGMANKILAVNAAETALEFIDNTGGGSGVVETIVAGSNITVDATDPANPIVSATGGSYTDEQAQDAVGTILTDSSEINFTYNDGVPSVTASIVSGSIDETKLDVSTNASLDLADSALQASAIDDTVYGAGWNGDTTHAPSKNAVYDKIESLSAGGGMTWSEVTGTTQSMSVNNGYIANNASLVVFTLPDTAALGSIVRVTGKGAGGWKISQNASEQIIWNEGGVDGTNETTIGTGGYLASTDDYDSIELICLTADTTWGVLSVKGNITLN